MRKELWLRADECTACGACVNACPKDALAIEIRPDGHLGLTAADQCIGCGLCERACPVASASTTSGSASPKIYAAWSRDESLRFRSTSGGVFSELARTVLARGGAVFGAAYGEGCFVRYELAENEEGLARLRQSKYVQSEVGLAYRNVRAKLGEGREVLFCGAPCQVAGLRSYLGGDREGLFLVDFVCRGVNSPKAYRAWLGELERGRGSKAVRVWFKYKVGGWKSSPKRTRVDFADGSHVVLEGEGNGYMRGYLDSDLYLRPSCADCRFKGFPRQGDVTVADFWGLDPALDDDKGTSLVMVSTPKGARLLERAKGSLNEHERSLDEVFGGNVCIEGSVPLSPKSAEFLRALDSMTFSDALDLYGKPSLLQSFVGKGKKVAKRFIAAVNSRKSD